MKKVTLRQELDALNLYLGIEQLRFGIDCASSSRWTNSLFGSRAFADPAAPGRECAQVRGRAARGAASSESSRGRADHLKLVVQDDGPACRSVSSRLGPRRRLRKHARTAGAPTASTRLSPCGFSRPGLRIEITLPFERARATIDHPTIIVDDEPLAAAAGASPPEAQDIEIARQMRERPRGAGRDRLTLHPT